MLSSLPISVTPTAAGIWSYIFFIPAAFSMAFIAQFEAVHKPQKYRISHLALWVFIPFSVLMVLVMCFDAKLTRILLVVAAASDMGLANVIFCYISKSMADTGEIDAIAWLLKTSPPQYPAAFFKKVGQMTGFDTIGCHYRARLLESLMPFFTLLIISHRAPEHPSSDTPSPSSSLSLDEDPHLKNLEIYIASLARLSEFTDYEGGFWRLWEDARQHPKLEQPLIDILVVFANPRHQFQDGLRSAAAKVLNNYELDMEGKPMRSPATVEPAQSVATVLRSAASLMFNVNGLNSQEEQGHPNLYRPVELELATHVEPPHSYGEIEEA